MNAKNIAISIIVISCLYKLLFECGEKVDRYIRKIFSCEVNEVFKIKIIVIITVYVLILLLKKIVSNREFEKIKYISRQMKNVLNKISFKLKTNSILKMSTVVIAMLVLILILVFDIVNIPTKMGIKLDIDISNWISVVVSCVCAIIGYICTIEAVKLTIKEQRIDKVEADRINAMPLIDVEVKQKDINAHEIIDVDYIKQVDDVKENSLNRITITFAIKNVGYRELYDLIISDIREVSFKGKKPRNRIISMLHKDKEVVVKFEVEANNGNIELSDNEKKIFFDCLYTDCYGNSYNQSVCIEIKHSNSRGYDILMIKKISILGRPLQILKEEEQSNESKVIQKLLMKLKN